MLIVLLVGTARNSTARRDAETRSADLKMSVRVYNYAGSSAGLLGIAESEAERIFAKAGVLLEWQECPITGLSESADPTCAAPLTPLDLQLRIVRTVKLMLIHAPADATGFTIGDLATVQLTPLLDLSAQTKCFLPLMLGRTIAHEIGHALLGGGHCSRGIMQARWGAGQLELASANDMVFTPDQVRALRLAVKTRTTH